MPRGSRLTAQPFAARAARTTWPRQGWPWIIAWSFGGSASPTSAASAPGKKPTNARPATSVPWLGELSLLHLALVAAGGTWPEGGQHCLRQLLTLSEPPTAIFCFNDLTATEVMSAAHAAGVHVATDLAPVGREVDRP